MCLVKNNLLQGNYVSKRSVRHAGIGKQRLQKLKDFCILSLKNFFLAFAPLRVVESSISSSISFNLAIINTEIVAGQLLGPANLPRAQALSIHKLT